MINVLFLMIGRPIDNTVKNSSVFSLPDPNPNVLVAVSKGMRGSKTLHQRNSPVLSWRCRQSQVDLFNGCKPMAVLLF